MNRRFEEQCLCNVFRSACFPKLVYGSNSLSSISSYISPIYHLSANDFATSPVFYSLLFPGNHSERQYGCLIALLTFKNSCVFFHWQLKSSWCTCKGFVIGCDYISIFATEVLECVLKYAPNLPRLCFFLKVSKLFPTLSLLQFLKHQCLPNI